MIQNLFKKVDNICTFLILTVMFVFPVVRLIAALRGTVLVGYELVMVVAAGLYLAWFVYVEIFPALRTLRTPKNVRFHYDRWLTIGFVLGYVIPTIRVNTTQVSENAVITSSIIVLISYMAGAYKFGSAWPRDYLATTLGYLRLVKNYAHPIVMDILKNDKPNVAVKAAPSTKGQNNTEPVIPVKAVSTATVKTAPAQIEKRAEPAPKPQPPVQPPVQQPVKLPAASFAAVAATPVSQPAPTVEELIGEPDEMALVETFVRLQKDRESVINKSAYALKTGEYTDFKNFTALIRNDAAKALKVYLGWLDESRGSQYRSEARKALGLS
jgi:hypothetical protein